MSADPIYVLSEIGRPIGTLYIGQTEAERTAGVTPTNYQYEPGNVLRYGATGDGATNDTTALLAAASCNRKLVFPSGNYRLDTEIEFDSTSPVYIFFEPGARITTIGATNRAFHFDGAPTGTTSIELVLQNVTIYGANSGTADCAIYLDRTALFWLHDTVIFGGGKFTDGILGYGAQQGEISGGYIQNVANCIHLTRAPDEGAGDSGSNGIDIHGVSLNGNTREFYAEDTDSIFFHHNHMIGAPIGVEIDDCQSGARISNNHKEAPSGGPFTAGIKVSGSNSQGVRIDGNALFGTGPGIWIAAGKAITVESNSFIQADLQYDSGTSYIRTINNYAVASGATTYTDNSTHGTKFGNYTDGTAFDWGDMLSPAQITADQNNYSPTGLNKALNLRLSTDASRSLTGLAGGWPNRELRLFNVGANDLVLVNASGSSTAANRFEIGANITIGAAEGVTLIYDGVANLWRCPGRYT